MDDATATLELRGRDIARRLVRIAKDGERYFPHCFRDGLYRVADPALGRIKHYAANQIAIPADQIEKYLEKGFLLRMRGEESGQVNLISSLEIKREVFSEGPGDATARDDRL